ncbi:MAG: hypothetical protein PQJ59_17785 [Spirochaetales bacterium]|nr:hypothetical protein [Spirochaetales bacterium]
MAINKNVLKIFFLTFFFPLSLFGQDNNSQIHYYFEMDEAGNPRFNQIISWEDLPGSLGYELVIKNLEEVEKYRLRSTESSQEVSLEPGHYLYSVIVYNMLDKPEYQSPWTPLRIYKAEMPVVEKITPDNLYIEENNYHITLHGTGLLPFSEYWLVSPNREKPLGQLKDFTIPKDGVVEITLPEDLNRVGTYAIKVLNPGGMSTTSEDSYNIRYLKPFDINLSLGYAPVISLYDSWFKEYWADTIYPMGTLARADLIFLKREFGYLGIELQGIGLLSFEGGSEEALIESTFFGGGLNLLYKYIYSEGLHLVARAGGGVGHSGLTFNYNGVTGDSLNTWDLYATGGLSLQYYFNRFVYAEAGADWRQVFYNGTNWGTLSPFVSVGLAY